MAMPYGCDKMTSTYSIFHMYNKVSGINFPMWTAKNVKNADHILVDMDKLLSHRGLYQFLSCW